LLGYLAPLLLATQTRESVPGLLRRSKVASEINQESVAILKRLWSFGWAVGIWLMLCQVLPIVGRSALQHYAGYKAAGTYASMYEVAVRAFSFFAFPVTQAAHPRIMQYWNQGQYDAARMAMRQSVRWQLLMFLPLEVGGVLFSRPLTALILGKGNSAPNSLLPLLMLGGFLWQLALLAHKPLEIMHRTKTMLVGMIVVFFLELFGNYVFVPRFGPDAVVLVFVLGAVAYLAFVALNNPLPAQGFTDSLP
jgi:O-antigen/teichoic acid export membrane protein